MHKRNTTQRTAAYCFLAQHTSLHCHAHHTHHKSLRTHIRTHARRRKQTPVALIIHTLHIRVITNIPYTFMRVQRSTYACMHMGVNQRYLPHRDLACAHARRYARTHARTCMHAHKHARRIATKRSHTSFLVCTHAHHVCRRKYNALHCAAKIDVHLVNGAANSNLDTVRAMLKVAPDLVRCPLSLI